MPCTTQHMEHTARHRPTIQRNTAAPSLRRSCHGVRIYRRCATARKSAVSTFVRLSLLISVQRD